MWTLSPCYSRFEKSANNWFGSMSQTEKQEVITALNPTSESGASVATIASKNGSSFECSLSVPHTSLSGRWTIKKTYRKSILFIEKKKVIKPPDSHPKTRWVASDTEHCTHALRRTIGYCLNCVSCRTDVTASQNARY